MTYPEALDFLYSRLPMFQRIGAPALKYDLSNTLRILEACGNPHKRLKCIHVAGTNGKGTSSHAIASILQAAHYRVGLFTSPHLKSFTERARINGVNMPEEFVSSFIIKYRTVIEEISPSFFEVTFAMSMKFFEENEVDWAVVETGLGGRLDSTNVIDPEVCLITMIGWDHADLLGDTLEKIAKEKAGIIKAQKPVVIGANQPELFHVFEEVAKSLSAPITTCEETTVLVMPDKKGFEIRGNNRLKHSDLTFDISASYFLKNLPGVLKVIELLQDNGVSIPDESIVKGLSNVKRNTGLKGRWQVLQESPTIVCDVSHNLPGLRELFEQANKHKDGELHLIIGMVRDKNISEVLDLITTLKAKLYFTQSDTPRSLSATELQKKALDSGLTGEVHENVNEAIWTARSNAKESDLILVCGSTFVVAEIEDL